MTRNKIQYRVLPINTKGKTTAEVARILDESYYRLLKQIPHYGRLVSTSTVQTVDGCVIQIFWDENTLPLTIAKCEEDDDAANGH